MQKEKRKRKRERKETLITIKVPLMTLPTLKNWVVGEPGGASAWVSPDSAKVMISASRDQALLPALH